MNSPYQEATSDRFRHLEASDAGRIAIVSFGIFGLSMTVLVGMGFQPGWANGWLISKHTVFASFATIMLVVGFLSLAIFVLIMLCCAVEKFVKRAFAGWASFLVVLTLVLLATAVTLPRVYANIRASIVQEWK